jgi:hypothetical protein
VLELAADGDLLPGDHQDPVAGHAALVSDRLAVRQIRKHFGEAPAALSNSNAPALEIR